MEPDPRTPAGAHRLRPLNQAEPVSLRTDRKGMPCAVELRRRWRAVARVEEVWRVDDGWWRPHPVRRTYFRLALEGGRPLMVYRDEAESRWLMQRY